MLAGTKGFSWSRNETSMIQAACVCVFVCDRETHKERKPGGIQIQKMKRKST